ncbi:MAG: relaxase/mobilization nuclease domain-containing protein [Flavipsychrobacter sp.]|nr:relaxase/mobilization nuclease domain-containing protein [Flavipsychrobacter sp.]
MIVKEITRKGNGKGNGNSSSSKVLNYIFKYIFKPEKTRVRHIPFHRTDAVRSYYKRGSLEQSYVKHLQNAQVSFTKQDINHLVAENVERSISNVLTNRPEGVPIHDFLRNYYFDNWYNLRRIQIQETYGTDSFIIKHNIQSNDIKGFIKEFDLCNAGRVHKRVDQTEISHHIVSFNKSDSHKVTESMLADMAKEFIRLRGENNMYVGTVHRDKSHIHLHIAMTGTQLNGLSSRISKSEFAEVKEKLQEYQKQKYPQLSNSLPEHGKAKRELAKDINEPKIYTRRTPLLDKDRIKECLDRHYPTSHSVKEFLQKISIDGFEIYMRNGRPQGVVENGLKHRFSKFGYDVEKFSDLQKTEEKESKLLEQFNSIISKHSRDRELDDDLELDQAFDDYSIDEYESDDTNMEASDDTDNKEEEDREDELEDSDE